MKKATFILILLIAAIPLSRAQSVSCDELISYVYENGRKLGTINESEIIHSEWLKKIEGYSINDKTVVIAEIYTDNKTSSTKYIFCGIPTSNWNSFYYGRFAIGKSLGEKFHEYIFDYKCDCK